MNRYITNIFILLVIISSVADSITPEEEKRYILNYKTDLCPPLGIMNKFALGTLKTTTKMFGCAYFGYDKPRSPLPLLHLWVENPQAVVDFSPDMRGNFCKRADEQPAEMDHFMFKCLSTSRQTYKGKYTKNGWYTLLQEYIADDQYENAIPTKFYRCALYTVTNSIHMSLRTIQMVISKPVTGEEYEASLCEGLAALMERNDLPMLPKGMRYWPDGSMYLYLLGTMPNVIHNSDTTTNYPEYSPNPMTKLLRQPNMDGNNSKWLLEK